MRLCAFKDYYCPEPAFEAVVVKFTTDPSARVAELESDRFDLTLEVQYEEAEHLRQRLRRERHAGVGHRHDLAH